MSFWAIDCAVDSPALRELGYSEPQLTAFCDAVETCLSERGFAKQEELGLYVSQGEDGLLNSHLACLGLAAMAGEENAFARLRLFRLEEATNLLPLVHARRIAVNPTASPTHGQIEPSLQRDRGASPEEPTVARIIGGILQDLFFDEPADGKSQAPPHATRF